MPKNDLNCLRCGETMHYLKTEKLQLGQTGWLLGDLPNLLAGSMELSVYGCPGCGKIEFFQADSAPHSRLPQTACPRCGKSYDFDYPKCPFCKYSGR